MGPNPEKPPDGFENGFGATPVDAGVAPAGLLKFEAAGAGPAAVAGKLPNDFEKLKLDPAANRFAAVP